MTITPDRALALARVSALYAENVRLLGRGDLVVASHGGSGQSLLGNVLAELGLNYVDAYTERLDQDGRATAVAAHRTYRSHLAAQHQKDTGAAETDVRLWPRFVKTHHPPVVFVDAVIGGVWLLVRDPRDALYSSFRWRRGFAEEPWDRVPDDLRTWLRGPGDFSRSPVQDWYVFYRAWAERAADCDHVHVVRFEDLKTRPVEAVGDALRAAGITRTEEQVAAAVGASSFGAMRRYEDEQSAETFRPRVMRAGRTEEWREWMTTELFEPFDDPQLVVEAARYGYDLTERP